MTTTAQKRRWLAENGLVQMNTWLSKDDKAVFEETAHHLGVSQRKLMIALASGLRRSIEVRSEPAQPTQRSITFTFYL